MTIEPRGYIIASESAIVGAGSTIEEAAGEALEWLDDYDTLEALITDLRKTPEAGHEQGAKPYLRRASAGLLKTCQHAGPPDTWTDHEGVACTAEEAAEETR
ncbi:hypothetical protein [Kushneria phosphatilytica]|uniref:Uncharacterized protein n=1 Tax=Kushneria phosphatilytica TaxID=657387 RepID=A0A1S1NWI2_9GAMM|nr:hypothetical protein [Kushneria phosphatilytica]OHV11503.1 hypothetical protein BH688_07025 [Kushneria phosphatilytica]QEL12101.1 hypothetical protein FY550_13785 [Kushneria phosphatilytica]